MSFSGEYFQKTAFHFRKERKVEKFSVGDDCKIGSWEVWRYGCLEAWRQGSWETVSVQWAVAVGRFGKSEG